KDVREIDIRRFAPDQHINGPFELELLRRAGPGVKHDSNVDPPAFGLVVVNGSETRDIGDPVKSPGVFGPTDEVFASVCFRFRYFHVPVTSDVLRSLDAEAGVQTRIHAGGTALADTLVSLLREGGHGGYPRRFRLVRAKQAEQHNAKHAGH